MPNQFLWYAYPFHPSRAKIPRQCKWGLSYFIQFKIACLVFSTVFLLQLDEHRRPTELFPVVYYEVIAYASVFIREDWDGQWGKTDSALVHPFVL